ILFEALAVLGERAEDRAVDRPDLEPPHAVPAHVEIRPHPALAANAAAERNRGQPAFQVVAPLVIDADVFPGVARELAPHQRAAMSAAVDEGMDVAVLVAIDDDRR